MATFGIALLAALTVGSKPVTTWNIEYLIEIDYIEAPRIPATVTICFAHTIALEIKPRGTDLYA